MIGVYELDKLLNNYGIDSKKVIKKNIKVIDLGFYNEIKKVLDYLIITHNVSPRNIEKCPSILYSNVNAIKYNYEFLKNTNLISYDIDTCLHILGTEPIELIKTYDYIKNNYEYYYLKSNTSILKVNIERIKRIENIFKNTNVDKKIILSACTSMNDIEEIEKIVEVCRKNNIEITGSVFLKTSEEIEKIVEVCKKNEIEITGSVFLKTSEEIEKIVEICKKNEIEITGSVFLKTSEEIEKIIEVCRKNNIEITGGVFLKTPEEIEKIVEVCRKNNIEITGGVFLKTSEEIEKIIEVCRKKNIEITGGVFLKTPEEIEKIVEVCRKNNIEITGTIFLKTSKEIEKIVEVCRKNNIEITGSVFLKTPEEIEKIVEVCKKNEIEITGTVFLKTSEEIEKIVEVCRKNNIEITGSVFYKTSSKLIETIEYLNTNFGALYLKSLIVSKDKKNLEKVLPYLQKLNILPIVINSPSILSLKLEEIIERMNFIKSINENIVENNKFNSIFGLSKKLYQQKKDTYCKIL